MGRLSSFQGAYLRGLKVSVGTDKYVCFLLVLPSGLVGIWNSSAFGVLRIFV